MTASHQSEPPPPPLLLRAGLFFAGAGPDTVESRKEFAEAFALGDETAESSSAQYAAAPRFGDSNAPSAAVIAFYKHWCGFASCRTFAECDRYNWAEAENRAVRRAMEKENNSERRKVRFKYNADIQVSRHLQGRGRKKWNPANPLQGSSTQSMGGPLA